MAHIVTIDPYGLWISVKGNTSKFERIARRGIITSCSVNIADRLAPAPSILKIIDDLQKGNGRFMIGMRVGNITESRRLEVANDPHPIASVLSCSDSRVIPEFIFDRSLGDIFVVRTAGNVPDGLTLGSLEYGCERLHTHLLLVLGHTRCAAVAAVCTGEKLPEHLQKIARQIQTAVDLCQVGGVVKVEQRMLAVIRKNVDIIVRSLPQKSAILTKLVAKGDLTIVGGIYNVENGAVEFCI